MAKTKREYILATCFLSGAAAILTLVSVGTQEWVVSDAVFTGTDAGKDSESDQIKFGLFSGIFKQTTASRATYELTMICAYDKNICALLCGDNLQDNLNHLYNNEPVSEEDVKACSFIVSNREIFDPYYGFFSGFKTNADDDRIFINCGVWICTIIFVLISGIMGIVSAGLAIWNTTSSPYQLMFSIFGMYIYNTIALFSLVLAVIIWGASFNATILHNNIPTYKTFLENFSTIDRAQLGYSYWINLAAIFLYIVSICLLYIRNYLLSKEQQVNVHLEDNTDPVIYLY